MQTSPSLLRFNIAAEIPGMGGGGGLLRAGRVSSNAREGIGIALVLTGPGGPFSTAEGNSSQ